MLRNSSRLFGASSRALVRQMSTSGGQKKSFFSSWTFRLGATAAVGFGISVAIDRSMFHPKIETEIVEDLMLKKGGLRRERIVVLGTGWASVGFLARIDPTRYEVICISPRNYFLMTPLLPSVTVGTIEPRTVVESVRTLFPWVKFVEAECSGVDPKAKTLTLCTKTNGDSKSSSRVVQDSAKSRPDFTMAYDKLVVAVGAENNTFNTPGVHQHAHFLKEIADARRIRSAITDAFESAANPGQTDEERRRLLNFVVVGGGPTGVEFAAELADLVHEDLKHSFPQLKGMVTIRLVEAMETVLSMFDKKISDYTVEHFKTEKIEVLANTFVKGVHSDHVMIQKKGSKTVESIPSSVVVWATGIKCRPIVESIRKSIGLDVQNNFRGLVTDRMLKVKGCDGMYSLGDCATIENKKLLGDVEELYKGAFELGGNPKAKGVTIEAFRKFAESKAAEYPQLGFLATTDASDAEFSKADKNRDGVLELHEFKAAMGAIDRTIKILPATAQVAAQEGKYLAKQFNQHPIPEGMQDGGSVVKTLREQYNAIQYPKGIEPFQYNHMGSLAYIGADQATADLNGAMSNILDKMGLSVATGKGVFLLWRSFYLSESFTTRTKLLLLMDWIRCKSFGRDISRY
jgi:NADH:ubiquinone reductase (non-electrogenic)